MALAVDPGIETSRRVADSAARAWARGGVTVVEKPLAGLSGVDCEARALVAVEKGIVECIVEDDFAPIAAAARRLCADGWRVAVLSPASRMGEAHRALRGLPVRVQPWWAGADDSVLFGVPEVP